MLLLWYKKTASHWEGRASLLNQKSILKNQLKAKHKLRAEIHPVKRSPTPSPLTFPSFSTHLSTEVFLQGTDTGVGVVSAFEKCKLNQYVSGTERKVTPAWRWRVWKYCTVYWQSITDTVSTRPRALKGGCVKPSINLSMHQSINQSINQSKTMNYSLFNGIDRLYCVSYSTRPTGINSIIYFYLYLFPFWYITFGKQRSCWK